MWREINEIRRNLIKYNTRRQCHGIVWYLCKIFVAHLQVKTYECLVFPWRSDSIDVVLIIRGTGLFYYFSPAVETQASPEIIPLILQVIQMAPRSTHKVQRLSQVALISTLTHCTMDASPSVTSPHMAHCPQCQWATWGTCNPEIKTTTTGRSQETIQTMCPKKYSTNYNYRKNGV